MIVNRILKIVLVLLSAAYILSEITKQLLLADIFSALLPSMLTILYIRNNSSKKPYLLLFLLFYSLSQILEVLSVFIPLNNYSVDYMYYLGNTLYMVSYMFLILRCMATWNFREILKKFTITILILIVLGVFCVTLITETAQTQLSPPEYAIEFTYNVIVMVLLSAALINYMYLGDKKAILFFIGSMFIFFSEMLQLAYYYVAELPHLAAIYSFFLVLAFTFFYLQSRLKHDNVMYSNVVNEFDKAKFTLKQ